jgi:hypothetical protein
VGLGAKRVYDTYKAGGDWKTETGNEAVNIGTMGAVEGARNIIGAAKAAKGWYDTAQDMAGQAKAQQAKYGTPELAAATRRSRTGPSGISSSASDSQPTLPKPQPFKPFEPTSDNLHSNLGDNSAPATQSNTSVQGRKNPLMSSAADANRAASIKTLQSDTLQSQANQPIKANLSGIFSGAKALQQKYGPYTGGN